MRHVTILLSALLSILTAALGPATAHAFCGFYVSGADASLYNNATMVVMMREGTRTVLSMQNNYQGPPEDFAMVVPVPVVLQKENVKTLPREIFDRVDQLAAPRLVEYWEQDPCYQERDDFDDLVAPMAEAESMAPRAAARAEDLGVTIEAQFKVAEYDIVILSARDSTGLDTWLRQEKYNIPAGAEPVLRPYVEKGTKFFVAKVDAERVSFEGGRAVLSPLRFHYDTDEFSLPVRLGLLNSAGQQDLIVHILANGQRYEAANYPNVAIPTNLVVVNAVRNEFGAFYDLLFRRTVAKNPGSVVTEYSWDASSCDPCPVTPLQPAELMTLGADVLHGDPEPEQDGPRGVLPRRPPRRPPPNLYGFVLTRLHYRYGKEGLEEDLVFRQGPPIVGGRGMPDQEGILREEGATSGSRNNFQGRYVILHRWEGEIACQNPRRGLWGGPPGQGGGMPQPIAAGNVAMKGVLTDEAAITSVGTSVAVDVPVLGITAGQAEPVLATDPGPPGGAPAAATSGKHTHGPGRPPSSAPTEGGCASCAVTHRGAPRPLAVVAALALLVARRRRQRQR